MGANVAAAGTGTLESLNQISVDDVVGAGLPDDVVRSRSNLGIGLHGLGHGLTALDPALAFEGERRRAQSEGATAGEQLDRGTLAAAQRADDVAVGVAAGAFFAGPAGAATGLIAGYAYGFSDTNEAVDNAIREHPDPQAMEDLWNENISP